MSKVNCLLEFTGRPEHPIGLTMIFPSAPEVGQQLWLMLPDGDQLEFFVQDVIWKGAWSPPGEVVQLVSCVVRALTPDEWSQHTGTRGRLDRFSGPRSR